MATALRRYISRYLSGKRGQNEINENNNLIYYLSKQELWDDDAFIDNVEFKTELSKLFDDSGNNSTIYIGQATKLYEFLGGDQSLLQEYFSKIEDKKEHNEHDNNKDGGEGQIQKEEENINEVKKEDKKEEQNEKEEEKKEEEKYEEEEKEDSIGYY